MTKIYGTCVPDLEDDFTPGWVWKDTNDELLDPTIFNMTNLPSCGKHHFHILSEKMPVVEPYFITLQF